MHGQKKKRVRDQPLNAVDDAKKKIRFANGKQNHDMIVIWLDLF